MKPKFLLSALLSFSFYLLSSQVPQGFNYQAIVRDGTTKEPIISQSILVRITIENVAETALYQETHSLSTDEFGIMAVVIGEGTPTGTDLFEDIDWNEEPLYIKTELQYPVGGSYTEMGTAPLQSVPYAMVADEVETKQTLSLAGSDLSISDGNTVILPTGGSLWTANGGNIYRPTGNVGIGISNPSRLLDIVTYNSSTEDMMIHIGENPNEGGYIGSYVPADLLLSGGADYVSGTGWVARDVNASMLRLMNGWTFFSNDAGLTSGSTFTPKGSMVITSVGDVGIGTTSPSSKLHIFSPDGSLANLFITGSEQGSALMYVGQSTLYGGGVAYDGQGTPDIVGGFDRITYFRRNNGTDNEVFSYGFWNNTVDFLGSLNVSEQVKIGPNAAMADDVPLFEVKNKYGIPVLAVYNYGVRILVDHTFGKAVKGGFAIGGFDYTKAGSTVNLMTVTPDSIRFNINNDDTKAVKGGFAIGGFDVTKGPINQDFMYITPQNSNNGQYNTFMGFHSGYSNLSTGTRNTFFGYLAGYGNTSGDNSVLIGNSAGEQELGSNNVYIGSNSASKIPQPPLYLPYDPSYENVIIGVNAGLFNQGDYNVIIGKEAGRVNNANGQVFLGWGAGRKNTTGEANVFVGGDAGMNNVTGTQNTSVGVGANCNTTGNYNTAVGYNAGSDVTSGGNNITIGTNSMVPSATGHDQVRIGNTYITYAGIQVAWTVTSDLKWKESIEDLTFGLNVISGLKPVDYIRKNNMLRTREAGFIAQDVEKLFNELGIENAGLLSKGYDGSLELRYNDFIPILTKAIQEQQVQIESQNQENRQLRSELESLKERMAVLESRMGKN